MNSAFNRWYKRSIILLTLASTLQSNTNPIAMYPPHTKPQMISPATSVPATAVPTPSAPATQPATPCTTANSTNIIARAGMQGISIPLWLAGTLGLLGMLSGGMVVYIALPRPGNIPLLSTTTEDELIDRDENTPST